MSWDKAKISDICSDIFDGPHATPPVSKDGAIFLGISNITPDGHLDLSNPKYINEADLPKWTKRVTPLEGDIVFSYEATLNLYAIIPPGFHGCLGRRMALIRPNENKVLGKFLFYYFFSDEWRKTIAENTVIGATVDRIPLIRFPNFPVSYPSIEKQFKIVEVLSSYDDLIKNNRKQIKLLEEAAQRLYKEWFVDLRFPSHETTPIIDGIPQGWEERNIDDVFSVQYGKMLPTSLLVPNGEYPVYGANGVIGYYTKANCFDYVTLITSRGNGSGDVLRTHHKASFVTNNSFVVLPKETYGHFELPFAYHLMKTLDFKSICTGSAQPQLTNKSISMLNVIVPTSAVVKAFCNIANPMFAKIELLYKQIQAAAEARDCLLPKLMNGEIEV